MERQIIIETLIDIGMPMNMRGFQYVVSAIELLDRPEWKCPKWTALYNCIGNIYDVSGSLVESSIRNILKNVRNKNYNFEKIEYYIGFENCENSNSLLKLYNRLKSTNSYNNNEIKNYLLNLLNA